MTKDNFFRARNAKDIFVVVHVYRGLYSVKHLCSKRKTSVTSLGFASHPRIATRTHSPARSSNTKCFDCSCPMANNQVLARVGSFVQTRIPECVDVEIEDPAQLEDADPQGRGQGAEM